MAMCNACNKQIPEGVAHCPYCGNEQARANTGAEKKTIFGFAPSPNELRKMAEGQPAAAPPPAAQPAGEQPAAASPATPAPARDRTPSGTYANAPTVYDIQAPPIGGRAPTAPHEQQGVAPSPFGQPPAGAPSAASVGSPPSPLGKPPAGAPPAGAPIGAPPAGAPMGAPPARTSPAAGAVVAGAAVAGAVVGDDQAPTPPRIGAGSPSAPTAAEAAAPASTAGDAPKVKLPGVTLAEGEFPIAVESPGAFFWIIFSIFGLLVITLPLALWILLRTASKRYIITNRRSIRIKYTGKVLDLPHDQLGSFKVSGFVGASNVSLRLEGKGADELLFGLCGPSGAMARLWGVLSFWVLNDDVDVNDAPPVNADGKRLDESFALDILLFDETQFRRGMIDGALMFGATVVTPNRFMWLRTQAINDDTAELPVYAFLLSLAQRMGDIAAFEAEVERVAKSSLAESISRRWENLVDPKMSRSGLVFEEKGKKCTLCVKSAARKQIGEYLNEKTPLSL